MCTGSFSSCNNLKHVTGKTIKQIELIKTGTGIVNINASGLYGGTYNYSLVVDGKVIDTKRMIIS